MSAQTTVLDQLIADLFVYRLRPNEEEPVALVGHLALMDIKLDERMCGMIMPTGETPISFMGFNCYLLPSYSSDKWLIGPKREMLMLRTLWMAAQDKEIRVFLQQWEESERKQRN